MPAAQVLGLRAVTEAAEVDDPLDPLHARHPGERRGGGALAGGEVLGSASTHRVDQVIRHVHPVACAAQRFWAQHVSLVQVEALALELAGTSPAAVAHQASHLPCRACQPGDEATSDESRRAGDEHPFRHVTVRWATVSARARRPAALPSAPRSRRLRCQVSGRSARRSAPRSCRCRQDRGCQRPSRRRCRR